MDRLRGYRSVAEMLADPRPPFSGGANICPTQIQACAIRVARLEANGVPDPGANNLYVSDSVIRMAYDPVYEEGDELVQKNGCGSLCVSYQEPPTLKRINIDLLICTQDPELSELLAGGTVLSASGSGVPAGSVGWQFPRIGDPISPLGVSIELWVKQVDDSGDQDSTYPYARYAFPRVKLRPGSKVFENAVQNHAFSGFAIENPNWYNGPANDWPSSEEAYSAVQWMPDDGVPTAVCGFQSLVSS